MGLTLEGPIQIDTLQKAWDSIIDHHEILRSSFHWEGLTEPLQCVHRQAKSSWTIEDWRYLQEEAQEKHWYTYIQQDRDKGYDLTQVPLMRLGLLRLGEERYRLFWSSHHILLDGWSTPIVLNQVFTVYRGLCEGKPIQIERTHPYRDYIAWLQKQDKDKAKAYWQNLLSGYTNPSVLGINKTSQEGALQPIYAEERIQLSLELTQALKQFAKYHQLTMATVLQGVWGILVSRYSNSDDIIFGSTVSGRTLELPGIDRQVGMFINTIPVRSIFTHLTQD